MTSSGDGKISADLQKLELLDTKQLEHLVGFTFQTLTSGRLPEEQLAAFAAEHNIKPKVLKETLKGLLFFLSESLRKNMSAETVTEELTKLGVDTLKVNELVDLQWKFGVTASTDSLKQVNTCFLQLKFIINTGNKTEEHLMEMTLPQFYKFLQQMEQAQRVCESYS